MTKPNRSGLILGLITVIAACLVIFVWIPLDTDTGYIEKVRRQVNIGDSLAPTLAAIFVLLGGVIVLLFDRPTHDFRVTGRNVMFLTWLLIILAVSFGVMRWLGPAMADLLTEQGYRQLRDTAPWKYIGFFFGGTAMITAMIALVEGRITLRGVLVGLAATVCLILVYDLPFDDLLLPPNGDV